MGLCHCIRDGSFRLVQDSALRYAHKNCRALRHLYGLWYSFRALPVEQARDGHSQGNDPSPTNRAHRSFRWPDAWPAIRALRLSVIWIQGRREG
jgi:hypothetical protein